MSQDGPTPEQVIAPLAHQPGTIWLDGGQHGPWSVLLWEPEAILTDPTDWPARARALGQPTSGDPALPFITGVAGYVGYEAGPHVAPVQVRAGSWEPPLWLGWYPGALLYHHASGRWHATGTENRQRQARDLLRAARTLPSPPPPPASVQTRTVSRETYLQAVQRAQALIAQGDCYQLNLSRVIFADEVGDGWEAWRRVRASSRPSWGAWLNLSTGQQVLCNSPELLLAVDGSEAVTVPIKGTRPRGAHEDANARWREALLHSDKEIAELTMIVDLCRNDLGRLARPGSVQADERVLVAHANVVHAEQRVRATLREGLDAWDALATLFPPGSVTGAPKIRATQRIAELEWEPRGVYCGAIGFASDHRRAAFNVAIRTAVFAGTRARWHVGGGIVADSDPEAEWEETVDKGTVLSQAITGTERR